MLILDVPRTAFSIFGVQIYWYGIIYACAVSVSWAFAYKLIKETKCGITNAQFDKIMFRVVVYCVVFARLGHVIFFEPQYYIECPSEILMFRNGGMSFHGGVVGIVFAIYTLIRKKICKISVLIDVLSFSASIGMFIGRFANFINQELYGVPTNSCCGVVFSTVDFVPRHPVQVYEALTEGLLSWIIMYVMYKRKISFGSTMYAVVFICVYSVSRFFIEFYKDVDTCILNLTTGQVLCIVYFIITCVFYIIYKNINQLHKIK